MIEMGKSDHQRAFLSLGQAVRVSAMLGLHRMDEDHIAERTGRMKERKMRPPALHPLPTEPVLVEECRRTMCAIFCLDRFEAGGVGWPFAIAEADVRLLLPCSDTLYEQGICQTHDNPLWWPSPPMTFENEEENGSPAITSFGWLCRATTLGGRICFECYRPAGPPTGGPFASEASSPQLMDLGRVLEMDRQLEIIRSKLNGLATVRHGKTGVNGPILMVLVLINCLFVNLHHLRVSLGLSALPFNPSAPIITGSPEFSMQRCLEGIHSLYEIVTQLAVYENMRTSPYLSRVDTFSSFVPYILYCFGFPAKFSVGDWKILVANRSRSEDVEGRVKEGDPGADAMPSGDDVFGAMHDSSRLNLIDALCDAMDRMGVVWEVGKKFALMIRGDRNRLAERSTARQEASTGYSTHVNHASMPNPRNSPSQASQAESQGSYH
ncbi:hypothetical protein T439DRAFT_354172 [Meredithblackwellia eburnea MCA 4105]